MFCTGVNNYLPDPKKDEAAATQSKGANNFAMEGGNVM